MNDSDEARSSASGSERWLVLLAAALLQLCLGAAFYSYDGFLAGAFQTYFIRGRGMAELDYPIRDLRLLFFAFFALAVLLAWYFAERFGPRKTALVGSALSGLGWVLISSSGSTSFSGYAYGLGVGFGAGLLYGASTSVVVGWFHRRRGLALGLSMLAFSLATVLFNFIYPVFPGSWSDPAGSGVVSSYSFFTLSFGLIFFLATAFLSLFLVLPPSSPAPLGSEKAFGSGILGAEMSRIDVVKAPSFFGIWICLALAAFATTAIITPQWWLGTDLVVARAGFDSGTYEAISGLMKLPFIALSALGALIFGYLTDRLGIRRTAILSFGLIAAAFALLLVSFRLVSVFDFILGYVIIHGCSTIWMVIAPAATAGYFGAGSFLRNYGMVFTAFYAGTLVFDMWYAPTEIESMLYLMIALAVLGLIIAYAIIKPPSISAGEMAEERDESRIAS